MSAYALGIDTGGTFTDAVIVDLETRKILAEAKAETTHGDLIQGIAAAIAALDFDDLPQVRYASLSTTLATNAIVEGHGCRVGLLLMGFEPDRPLPRCELRQVKGKVDLHGVVTEAVDKEEVVAALASLAGKVDAVAVSGLLSIRNPEPERQVKTIVRETLGLPCVAAHEFSTALGMQERTVTAVLNAGLLAIIDELLDAVKAALAAKGMDIPLMVVRGDGSLMTESTARYRPIETILSGPAASIIGAGFLRGQSDAVVLDMGGTTTDIAVMKNGRPRMDPEGATVGGWRTRVEAAQVYTFGLGGDSRVYRDGLLNHWRVGPRRVCPIAVVAREYPAYAGELRDISARSVGMFRYELCEGLILLRPDAVDGELSVTQSKVLRALAEGPHTLYHLAQIVGVDADLIQMDALIESGAVAMVGFTPTDLLHCDGSYCRGDAAAAQTALALLARHLDGDVAATASLIRRLIDRRLYETLLESACAYEGLDCTGAAIAAIVDKAYKAEAGELLQVPFTLALPVVGIGAPIAAWLPSATVKLHTEAVFPDHYHVANAVGAAAGKVVHLCRVTVENHELDGVHVYAPWGRKVFGAHDDAAATADDVTAEQMHIGNQFKDRRYTIEEAIAYAIEAGKKHLLAELGEDAENYDFLVEREDREVVNGYSDNLKMFLSAKIEVLAVQRMAWG